MATSKRRLRLWKRSPTWAIVNLDRSRSTALDHADSGADGEWCTLTENLYRAFELTGNPRSKSFGDIWHYKVYWGMSKFPTRSDFTRKAT
jgi:hypothetical protein